MKIIRHISFLLLVSVFFIQCKKNREPEPTTFTGKVTDNVQGGIPVANATVKLKLLQTASNSVFNSSFTTIATTSTDANGNYIFTVTPENAITFKIVVEKNLYFGKEKEISADVASPGTSNETNFGIDPLGWFKVNIKNTTPFDVDDNILYQNTSESSGCSSCCNNLPVSLDGMNIDTFFICKRVAYPTISFNWFVTKNTITNPFTGSVNSIIGDTVEYNLNY
jgi:hypothetical protein